MLVGEVMAHYPAFIRAGSDVRRAAELLCVSEVGQLMVVDHEGRFVGALAEEDLVRALLPRFEDVTGAGGSLADAFALFLERGREVADRSIDPLVTRDAVTVMGATPEPGVPTPARMTSDRGVRAYVDVDAVSRAALGVALILLCGLGIVRATGVSRLPQRRAATVLSVAGPMLLLTAMLAVTY